MVGHQSRSVIVPSPSCAYVFSPQQKRRPSVAMAHAE
jgi:hypothetical protein